MFCAEFDEINDTNGCPHGARNNSCSKLACLRGLGEPCDVLGMPILHGDCADGLFCACGQCVGCIKGRCGQDDCLLQRRHWKGSNTISYKLPVQQLESVRYRKRMMKMPLLRFGYDYANGEEWRDQWCYLYKPIWCHVFHRFSISIQIKRKWYPLSSNLNVLSTVSTTLLRTHCPSKFTFFIQKCPSCRHSFFSITKSVSKLKVLFSFCCKWNWFSHRNNKNDFQISIKISILFLIRFPSFLDVIVWSELDVFSTCCVSQRYWNV